MMNPLLLTASLAPVRRHIGDAVNQTLLGAAAYGVLTVLGAVALAFFTAAGFLHLAGAFTTILACVIIAGIYAVVGLIGFLVLLLMRRRRRRVAAIPILAPVAAVAAVAKGGFPGGIASVGLLALAGYLMAGSMSKYK